MLHRKCPMYYMVICSHSSITSTLQDKNPLPSDETTKTVCMRSGEKHQIIHAQPHAPEMLDNCQQMHHIYTMILRALKIKTPPKALL